MKNEEAKNKKQNKQKVAVLALYVFLFSKEEASWPVLSFQSVCSGNAVG